jgi:hypothetical protein
VFGLLKRFEVSKSGTEPQPINLGWILYLAAYQVHRAVVTQLQNSECEIESMQLEVLVLLLIKL